MLVINILVTLAVSCVRIFVTSYTCIRARTKFKIPDDRRSIKKGGKKEEEEKRGGERKARLPSLLSST